MFYIIEIFLQLIWKSYRWYESRWQDEQILQRACTDWWGKPRTQHISSCNFAANRSTSLTRPRVQCLVLAENWTVTLQDNITKVRKKYMSKMTKRLETVATMACMKTLLMLFNCVFWVREGRFIWCNPPLTYRFEKACYLGIACTQLLHNMLLSHWRVDVLLSKCFFLFKFLFITLWIFIYKFFWRNGAMFFKFLRSLKYIMIFFLQKKTKYYYWQSYWQKLFMDIFLKNFFKILRKSGEKF